MHVAPRQPRFALAWPCQEPAPPTLVDVEAADQHQQERDRQKGDQWHAIFRGQHEVAMRVPQPSLRAPPRRLPGHLRGMRIHPHPQQLTIVPTHQRFGGKALAVRRGQAAQAQAGVRPLRSREHFSPTGLAVLGCHAHGGFDQPIDLGRHHRQRPRTENEAEQDAQLHANPAMQIEPKPAGGRTRLGCGKRAGGRFKRRRHET